MNQINKKKLAVIVLVTVMVVLAILVAIAFKDIAPPDVSDLSIAFLNIPEEENAFTFFNDASALVTSFTGGDQRFVELIDEGSYDAAELTTFLETNERVIELFERGLECEGMQFPRYKGFSDDLPYLAPMRKIARMQSNRALHLFKQGHEEEAFEVLLDILRFGDKIQTGKGPLINYLIGTAVKGIALERFRELLTKTTLESEQLLIFVNKLEVGGSSEEGLADALRAEYQVIAQGIDDIRSGKLDLRDLADPSFWSLWKGRLRIKPSRYSLKPNKTKWVCAEAIKICISNISRPFSNTRSMRRADTSIESMSRRRVLVQPNAVGKIICASLVPLLDRVMIQKCRGDIEAGATQLFIALRCWKLDRGDLPERLDELVPKYIKQVPLDAFDGKQLRYSKQKRVIYSVGEDLKDSGGPTFEDLKTKYKRDKPLRFADDPAFRVGF